MGQMQDSESFRKALKEVLASGEYLSLKQYEDVSTWNAMEADDRQLLADLFTLHAEKQMLTDETAAFESYTIARRLYPKNPVLLFQQATWLVETLKISCLKEACLILEELCELQPDHFEGWNLWANALACTGVQLDDSSYLIEAEQKFNDGYEVLKQKQNFECNPKFYASWGLCWYLLGKSSGEASDFKMAIDKYKLAEEGGCAECNFYADYGNALVDIGCLITSIDLIHEGIDYFHQCIKIDAKFYDGWFFLACAYLHLYEFTRNEEFARISDDAFKQASQIDITQISLWYTWGRLQLAIGKTQRNSTALQGAISKFERAEKIDSEDTVILGRWAEALLLLAGSTEDLGMMYLAQQKVSKALKLNPEDVDLWCVYGCSFIEIGRYFSEEKYYKQAIEQFQHVLTLTKRCTGAWYGMALAHFALAQRTGTIPMMEKAIKFCGKAVDSNGGNAPHLWNDWGVAYLKLAELTFQSGYIKCAIEKFEMGIHLCKQQNGEGGKLFFECLYNYGCAYDFLGDFYDDIEFHQKAVHVLEQVLEGEPDNTFARYNLALALSHCGEVAGDTEYMYNAMEIFRGLAVQDPEDDVVWNDWGVTLLQLACTIEETSEGEEVDKLYKEAEEKLLHAIALGYKLAFYNLACLHSLARNYTSAIHYLEKAERARCLPDVDDMLHDEWLENLRSSPLFHSFIAHKKNDVGGADSNPKTL